jgi:hypothetical protein
MISCLKRLFRRRKPIARFVDENDSEIAQDLRMAIEWRIDKQRLVENLKKLEERIACQYPSK